MLIYGGIVLLIIAHFFDFYILSDSILYMIMYVWSRKDPDAQMNIYGFRFRGAYLPWIYLLIKMVMGNDIIQPLIGIGVGHLYFFIIVVLPTTYNYTIIKTPLFIIQFIQYFNNNIIPINPNNNNQNNNNNNNNQRQTGHRWGRGNVLGAN